jgi:olfactory receptor
VFGFLNELSQELLTFFLSFCGFLELNHSYCADPPLTVLVCSDIHVKKMAMFVVAGFTVSRSHFIIVLALHFNFSGHIDDTICGRQT